MPRLRSAAGTVVSVPDAMADRLRRRGYVDIAPPRAAAPSRSATKAEWIEHAVASGADPDEAESMTKADLVERFG